MNDQHNCGSLSVGNTGGAGGGGGGHCDVICQGFHGRMKFEKTLSSLCGN